MKMIFHKFTRGLGSLLWWIMAATPHPLGKDRIEVLDDLATPKSSPRSTLPVGRGLESRRTDLTRRSVDRSNQPLLRRLAPGNSRATFIRHERKLHTNWHAHNSRTVSLSTGVLGKYRWKLKEDPFILTPYSQLDGTTCRPICQNISERGRKKRCARSDAGKKKRGRLAYLHPMSFSLPVSSDIFSSNDWQ